MDLLSMHQEHVIGKNAPLAERMRPRSLDEVVGQEHFIGEGKPLARLIRADRVPSLIFFGPPGSGKTTLATVIAETTNRNFRKLSAVTAGVKEIREIVEEAKNSLLFDRTRTILFIDEIHRFNKSQQDALLPHVEDGTLTLIGATTENPFFEVNKALLSRVQIVELKQLSHDALSRVLDRALQDRERGLGEQSITLTDDARQALITVSGGDARVLLNTLEIAVLSTNPAADGIRLTEQDIRESAQNKLFSYDKGDEEHYNTISAFIKSVRGSDPDAAIYYLARMLTGGEDPLFIARRLCILASEDIGNAEPMGIVVANACYETVHRIGMPEARIVLAQATTFLASSPKSNASYLSIDSALSYVRSHAQEEIPSYLKDSHYQGASALGRGIGYLYPHDYPGGFVLQNYMPDEIMKTDFYHPKSIGKEREIRKYLESLRCDTPENGRLQDKTKGGKNGD
ncbi:MAG: replication-associated recombination protein A [Peptoniphilaceae bacterium]|nr:replication-associated recombination protein A [Peptoniphilaceae bacterium]MCI6659440.1 replication-associated recombination protein A [Peptoniphilaceae bacterium]MDD7433620.1 replication-associated recombination protein A [Peptoniphilaceae bacterium]MDY3076085.1 replication-associated recombination protein A [Peptoniphilaceae bacterium]MDY3987499.1 replication-associated recombination protein A [Peptoniphilaceae bacterium]